MRILLQFPEGLKQKATEFAKKYEADGHEVFLSASACYGACDIALDEARWIKADKIIHFGHNRFVKANFNPEFPVEIEYVDYAIEVDINSLTAILPYLKNYKTIVLATTVQHIHQFEDMRAFLEKNGKKVLVGKGERAGRPGQILGCDDGAVRKVEKNADAIVFVGSGMFHPLAINVRKPVFVFNPSDTSVKDIQGEIERLRKKRRGAIAKALSSRYFGILLSTKAGQFNPVQASWAKKELEKRGYHCSILVANELEPLALKNFMVFDCFVNAACPRMADDTEEFGKPILNLDMLREFFEIVDANYKINFSMNTEI